MVKQRIIAFSTFLKLIELDEQKKKTMLRGFLRGGGFNYWRPLQVLSQEIIQNKLDFEGLSSKMESFAKGHQQKYNKNALIKILDWKSKRTLLALERQGRFEYVLGNSGFTVKMEPELAFSLNGSDYLAHVWATNTPTLSESTFSVGLYMLKLAAENHGIKSKNFLIIDTVKDRSFGEFNILANSESMLNAQSALLGALWQEINNTSNSEVGTDVGDYTPPPSFN
ncbi:MAG: hypothetical protein COC17_03785 [Hyphomicrobiales bacterium]|nr:hypothetical protein [Hyphomicrobiales bacterium]PCH50704.1 MAG: hypothetical protein COC17_03785 [Hyphomicrobiales bacterium]